MDKKLINAVIRQAGKEYLEDVYNQGASCGCPGFTYYVDTVKFFKKNKKEIVKSLEEVSEDFGEDVITMIKSFGCFKEDNLKTAEIAKVLYGGPFQNNDISTHIMNGLS